MLSLSEIFAGIIDNPFTPRFYKELQDYYNRSGMDNEAKALSFLISKKFDEKNDNTSGGEKQ